jgi:hypothetical protein
MPKEFEMLRADDGAKFEYDLKETEVGFGGWRASYQVTRANLEKSEPEQRFFFTKADALGWLVAEATARAFTVPSGDMEPDPIHH